jgi:nudix-type nucleoside diphosphatase (YffH/AdpP family)
MSTLAAAEYMEGFGTVPRELAARRLAQMRQRAWSRVLARAGSVPPVVRSGPGAEQVKLLARRRPYTNYFTLEEHDLRFPLFDGSMSAPVTRAAFVSGDAVTVLPYDARRDRVLVVEQFRAGPFVRGDRWPWTLEPVAGRIDPGETPEAAARRELAEEAGLEAGHLYWVGRYYPSPGACSEYLHAFVAEADLPDGAAGTFGVDHEAEDIRGHLLGFAAAMELLSTGEADTGPLILSLLWLAARREAIRAGA